MPLMSPDTETYQTIRKTHTFTDVAGQGATGQVIIFTISGRVLVQALTAFCTVDLTGAGATLSLGTAANVIAFVGVTTATTIDANTWWHNTTPVAGFQALPAALKEVAVSSNITGDVLVAGVTAGAIVFTALYVPLTVGASLS